jgi:arachidonate 15-lipoxygenase
MNPAMTSRLSLPQNASPNEQALRARTLFAQREAYQWVHAPGRPPSCRGVPKGEGFDRRKRLRMKLNAADSWIDLGLARLRQLRGRNDTVDSFRRYFSLLPMPKVAARWASDQEFARQRLDGVNPILIRSITEMPENFPVTDETLRGLLPGGTSMAAMLAQRRMYLSDYRLIHDLPLVMGRFQTAPMALFWVDETGRLLPLAIQLGQSQGRSPREAPTIFTPKDEYWLWRTARAHVQCADGT